MIEQLYIPGPLRPGVGCSKSLSWKKIDGFFVSSCRDSDECFGCKGEFRMNFDVSRVINFKEIRAPNEEDYVNTGFNIVTTEDFDKKALKEYIDSPEKWYFFHDFICDEDRICVFQLKTLSEVLKA